MSSMVYTDVNNSSKRKLPGITGIVGPLEIGVESDSDGDVSDPYDPGAKSDDEIICVPRQAKVRTGEEDAVRKYTSILDANNGKLEQYISEMASYIQRLPYKITSNMKIQISHIAASVGRSSPTIFLDDTAVKYYQENIYDRIPALILDATTKLKLIINYCFDKISNRITAFQIAATEDYTDVITRMTSTGTIIPEMYMKYIQNLQTLLTRYREMSLIYYDMYIYAFGRLTHSLNIWVSLPRDNIKTESTDITFFSHPTSIITSFNVVNSLTRHDVRLNLETHNIPLHQIISRSYTEYYELPTPKSKPPPYVTPPLLQITESRGASIYNKYLKYKQKYLALKRSMKSLSIN